MKRSLLWRQLLLLPIFLLLFSGVIWAEDDIDEPIIEDIRPFLSMSVSSFNDFIRDLKIIGDAANNPAFAATVEGPIRLQLGHDLMSAVNQDGRIGILIQSDQDGISNNFIAVLPVEDPNVLIDYLTSQEEDIEYIEREDGVIEWNEFFLKEVNGYTYIYLREIPLMDNENLAPEDILGPADGETVSCCTYVDNMPSLFKVGMEQNLDPIEQEEDECDEHFAKRKEDAEMMQKRADAMQNVYNSIGAITWGMHVSSETNTIHSTVNISVKDGTELAELCQKTKDMNPLFSGFANTTGQIYGCALSAELPSMTQLRRDSQETVSFAKDGIATIFGEDSEIGNEITDVLKSFAEKIPSTDVTQTGFVLDAKRGDYNVIFATQAKLNPENNLFSEIERILQDKLGKEIVQNWVKSNVKTDDGLVFDTLTIQISDLITLIEKMDDDSEKATLEEIELIKSVLGEQIVLFLGGKDDQVYYGVGTNPLMKLKTCLEPISLDKQAKFTFDLRQIFILLEQVADVVVESIALEDTTADSETQNEASEATNTVETEFVEEEADDDDDVEEYTNDTEFDSTYLAEELRDIELEAYEEEMSPAQQREESLQNYKKMKRSMSIFLEIMKDTEHTDAVFEVQCNENGIQMQVELEEGITRIIGMLPSLLLMNSL